MIRKHYRNMALHAVCICSGLLCNTHCRIVQKVINDTIKEHLFGPDLTSTDENSPHSPESGDEGMWLICILNMFCSVVEHSGYEVCVLSYVNPGCVCKLITIYRPS